ncbi:MAG: hypothetical protein JXQ82_05120 [Methanomicrobiaceae archaeon]|nr:hypothetical protein [Methanomicrobiaceae archaeon]
MINNLKFSGAFAGFVGTFILTWEVYFKIINDVNVKKNKEYREIIDQLRFKVIKGAPCPKDYEPLVDEKYKLVFTYPTNWIPEHGILYKFIENLTEEDKQKRTPAKFTISRMDRKKLISLYKLKNDFDKNLDNEKLKSLNEIISERYILNFKRKMSRDYPSIKFEDFDKELLIVDSIPSQKIYCNFLIIAKELIEEGEKKEWYQNEEEFIKFRTSILLIYNSRLNSLFEFSSWDNYEDYNQSSITFNNVVNSIRFI